MFVKKGTSGYICNLVPWEGNGMLRHVAKLWECQTHFPSGNWKLEILWRRCPFMVYGLRAMLHHLTSHQPIKIFTHASDTGQAEAFLQPQCHDAVSRSLLRDTYVTWDISRAAFPFHSHCTQNKSSLARLEKHGLFVCFIIHYHVQIMDWQQKSGETGVLFINSQLWGMCYIIVILN